MTSPVICFGEALWDCLPRGLFLGGAPLNVAYHLHRLGRAVMPVSAVGTDALGDEILRRLDLWGLTGSGLSRNDLPTGMVRVHVDAQGQPSYEIVEQVAWDAIALSPAAAAAIDQAPALVYGSLAQRTDGNRHLLGELRARCPGLQIYDINLRQPYDDIDVARELARGCDLIKVNDLELARLVGAGDLPSIDSLATAARSLVADDLTRSVCVTAGARGAGLLDKTGNWHWCDPEPITIRDAVGAGDAFMAALIDGLLHQAPPDAILLRASRLAEFVACSDGATPSHDAAPAVARELP